MQQLLIQFPIKSEKKEIWESLLFSDLGLPYTKTMPGFISAEHGFSQDKSGKLIWYLWEKWQTKEDYNQYILTAPRQDGSKFSNALMECLGGDPSEIWVDLL